MKHKWIPDEYDFYDIHAHINDAKLFPDIDGLVGELIKQKIIVNVAGTNEQDSIFSLKISEQYKNTLFSTIGFHPYELGNLNGKECFCILEKLIIEKHPSLVGLGEFGLDYYKNNIDHNQQKDVFISLLNLAKKYNLPCILHIRNAHDDAINILKEYGKNLSCVIHSFTENLTVVKEYLKMGYYISVNGIITFDKNVDDILNAIKMVPLNRILIETDSPWLTPVPFRGKTNSPLLIEWVFKKLIQIYEIDQKTLKNQLKKNCNEIFFPKK